MILNVQLNKILQVFTHVITTRSKYRSFPVCHKAPCAPSQSNLIPFRSFWRENHVYKINNKRKNIC